MLGRQRRAERSGTPVDVLIVGLGNPGEEYVHTRHNVGAEVVELLAARHDVRLRAGKEHSRTGSATWAGRRVVLAVPTTYMNESGRAVAALVRRCGVQETGLVVVHDEIDLSPLAIRIKVGGGLAGHNGLRSIAAHLHAEGFMRVRIGVGKPPSKEQGADHVLSRFSRNERVEMDAMMNRATEILEVIVAEGVDAAMDRFH